MMKFPIYVLLAAAAATSLISQAHLIRHDNEKVIRLPYSPQNLQVAKKLHLDVWSVSKQNGIDVRVNSVSLKKLESSLNLKASVVIPNLQQIIDSSSTPTNLENNAVQKKPKNGGGNTSAWHTAYHAYDDNVKWLQDLAKTYPQVVAFVPSIGTTPENRAIPMIKLNGKTGATPEKKRVWLQSMQHAREWITGATTMYIAETFASQYGKDERITHILDTVEVIIVPMCNPDGYEYTRKTDRMWRKTRGTDGLGVDPNRNWPDHWGQGGSSDVPEDEIYMGPSAGSAPEVQALMKAYQESPNVIAAVDFHSYSQLILRPYGWTDKESKDEKAFTELGEQLKKAYAKDSEDFTNERIVDLYVASGGASDWFYNAGTDIGKQKPYGISIELPPSSAMLGGFVLPPEKIIPVGKDTTEAMIAMIDYALAHPLGIKTASDETA